MSLSKFFNFSYNILNFDELKVTRARSFCMIVDQADHDFCFKHIATSIASQALGRATARELCAQFQPHDRDLCLAGAGIQ